MTKYEEKEEESEFLTYEVYTRLFLKQIQEIEALLKNDGGYRWESRSHFIRCAIMSYINLCDNDAQSVRETSNGCPNQNTL